MLCRTVSCLLRRSLRSPPRSTATPTRCPPCARSAACVCSANSRASGRGGHGTLCRPAGCVVSIARLKRTMATSHHHLQRTIATSHGDCSSTGRLQRTIATARCGSNRTAQLQRTIGAPWHCRMQCGQSIGCSVGTANSAWAQRALRLTLEHRHGVHAAPRMCHGILTACGFAQRRRRSRRAPPPLSAPPPPRQPHDHPPLARRARARRGRRAAAGAGAASSGARAEKKPRRQLPRDPLMLCAPGAKDGFGSQYVTGVE